MIRYSIESRDKITKYSLQNNSDIITRGKINRNNKKYIYTVWIKAENY